MAKTKKGNSKPRKKDEKETEVLKDFAGTYDANYNKNLETVLDENIDGSMRLFGVPHQFLEHNDPRIGDKSKLGRCFSERIIMEAPIICLKPGLPEFLPKSSDDEKKGLINGLIAAASGDEDISSLLSSIEGDDEDPVLYYGLKDAYNPMMAKVNILCKMMAVFLGIKDTHVPWVKNERVTFGNYDWRYYSFKNVYNDVDFTVNKDGGLGAFVKNAISNATTSLMTDTQWLRFYVDSSASFSESISNSTTTSMLENYAEKLEGVAKELDTISGMSGMDVKELAKGGMSSVDNYIQQNANGDSAIGTLLKRITGNATQIVSGGNFLIPEIWSDSDYSKGYSFSITLSTPYGCAESWFINIGVPLMHILALCLPQQLTANTYKAPYFVKCYSPGWFNCNYGIIDSVNIEKGSDNSWGVGGLPNEIKISLSVKDLYPTLSLPVEPYNKMATFLNTGMLEFLMVNCGVDITSQNMGAKLDIWKTILSNNFTDRFTSKPYQIQNHFKNKIQGLFNVIK